MANIIAAGSGNFTTAATWQTSDALAELDSEAGTTAIGTATTYSATWTTDTNIVDAICVKLSARVASPSGTFKVILRNTTGAADVATVTVNVADLPASGLGWQTFKLGSTPTLLTGNAYAIGVACSVASEVTLFRNATASNWSRKVRTTTTQAPAVNNHILVSNELTGAGTKNALTVTHDNTATTSFGPTVSAGPPQGIVVSGGGTLTLGTASSTAYYFKFKGIFYITGDGTVNLASVGTPLPATSSFTWFCDCIAAGDSGVVVGNGGTLKAYGATKTSWTSLTVDVALGTSTFTSSNNTGWLIGDTIVLAPTDRTPTHQDALVILGTSGTGTTTTSTTCTALHSGTTPTQAEIINITRNIKFTSVSTTLTGYIYFDTTSVGVLSNIEVSSFGSNNSTKYGISCAVTTGSLTVQNCGLHDSTVSSCAAFRIDNTNVNNFIFDSNAVYNVSAAAGGCFYLNAALTNTAWSVTNNVILSPLSGRNFQIQSVQGTITGNVAAANSGGDGFYWQAPTTNTAVSTGNRVLNVSGNVSHSHSNTGFSDNGQTFIGITFGSMKAYRNNGVGIVFSGISEDVIVSSATTFGNSSYNLQFGGVNTHNITFNNLTAGGDTSFATTQLFNAAGGCSVVFNTCTIDVVTGIFTQHTNLFGNGGNAMKATYNNCSVNPSAAFPAGIQGGANYVSNPSSFSYRQSFIAFQNFNGTTTDHRFYTPIYTVLSDNVIFGSAAPSEKLIPFSTTLKSWSSPRQITVASGGTHVVTVALRASAAGDAGGVAYSGNNPRLMQRANASIGLLNDTPLATFTLATGVWGTVTGTTGAAAQNGVQEFYIDADGTSSAWINIDDWTVT